MRVRADAGVVVILIQLLVVLFLLVGEVRCIVKAVRCNWDPIGKAEIVYTAGAVTGLGGIVGWINVEDE